MPCHFVKARPIRISLRHLGTPHCILWSVRFFLTHWDRDDTIIRNLVKLQSDYTHMVFRLWHLPTAQVASVLAFSHFGTEQGDAVFSQTAKAWLRCQLSHLAGPSLPQQSMVTHQLVRISWQTPKLILNVQLCAFPDIYALGTKYSKHSYTCVWRDVLSAMMWKREYCKTTKVYKRILVHTCVVGSSWRGAGTLWYRSHRAPPFPTQPSLPTPNPSYQVLLNRLGQI